MAQLPGKKFLRSNSNGEGPGVLTTLLRVYIEDRDRSALDAFFELLYDDHFADLAIQVHSYGKASDFTVREVIDDSLSKLLEDVIQEKYRKAPESAAKHLKYLLRRRFIDRRRYWDRDHDDVAKHRETILDLTASDPADQMQGQEDRSELDSRFQAALSSLPVNYARMIQMRLEGKIHEEVAAALGVSPSSARKSYSLAIEQLLSHLARSAPTLVMRLKALGTAKGTASSPSAGPTLEEVRGALPRITERVRNVLERLHFKGESRKTLVAEFGEETLSVLLRRGYDILEARFKVSFPEAFERAQA